MIPEKVTAVWVHNETGMHADQRGRLQTLVLFISRTEAAGVCFDPKRI